MLNLASRNDPAIPQRTQRIWRKFVEAVIGTRSDCTQAPVGEAMLLLGIPMILEMSMESVFAVTDIFFVGHLGMNAVATIGLTEALLSLVYTVAGGLGIGATAMVARRVGERDLEGAATTAVQAVALGVLVSVVIAVIGVTFAPSSWVSWARPRMRSAMPRPTCG